MTRLLAAAAVFVLAASPGASPGAFAQVAGGKQSNAPASSPQAGGTASQTQATTGSGQNAAASVTQPGTAQTTNSGQNQTGNYGTGMAGGRAETNPFPAAK